MIKKEEEKADQLDKIIPVYSILFMLRTSKEDAGSLSFTISKDLMEIKKCFDFASTVMVPGEDMIKVILTEMPEKEFDHFRFTLSEEQKIIKERGMK